MKNGLEARSSGESNPNAEMMSVPLDSPQAQMALMFYSYRKRHPESEVSFEDLMNNSGTIPTNDRTSMLEVAEDAMREEWTEEKENGALPLNKRYRMYVEAHPMEMLDSTDEHALSELLAAITSDSKPTLH